MPAPPSIDTTLSVRVAGTDAAFRALHDPWNALVDRIGGSIFLRHEWFSAAWAWRRTEAAQLFIVGVYDGDQLVGLLPLLRPAALHGGARLLQFLGVPDSQWCDALIDPRHGPRTAGVMVRYLIETAAAWDVLRLERLALRSSAATWLAPALVGHGLAARVDTVDCNLCVDLTKPWGDYQATLSRSIKKTRNLAANRLARAGHADLQWITPQSVAPADMGRLVDEIVAISARSWKHVTGTSLDRAGPQAFIRELTTSAYAQGWLSVWCLRLDGRPVAMEYQLLRDGHIHALRADFDDQYQSISPGSYLNFCMLERLFADRHRRYYMGPGNNPYKSRWSETGDPVQTLTSYAPTMRGRAGELWSEVKPRLRTWRDRLTAP